MATSQEYAGRTVDVAALHPSGRGPVASSLFFAPTGGQVCAGVQRLVQAWLIEFMTEQGSIAGQPERGSTFMIAVRRGYVRNGADVELEFGIAAAQVEDRLSKTYTAQTPLDEQIVDSRLVGYRIDKGSYSLTVIIETAAGTSVRFIAPIPVTITAS
jgi:hypothetical protein